MGSPTPEPAPARHGRARGVVAAVLAVLAVITCVLSLLSLWTLRTLTNTTLFVDRVGVIVQNPAVAQEIGDAAAAQLMSAIDVQQRLDEVLPPRAAAALAAPVSAGMQQQLADAATKLVGSPKFQTAWERSLTISHELAMGLLSGESTQNVTTGNGTITVDIVPLINTVVAESADALGNLLNRTITPPDLTADTIDDAVAELNKALGTNLPADFGTITLVQSENLATVQSWYSSVRTIVWLAPIAALLMVALAVAVARRRLRALLWMVVGVGLLLFFVGLLTSPLEAALLNAVQDSGLRTAVGQAFNEVLSSLMSGITVAVGLGIVAALALFFTGDSRAAATGRGAAARTPELAVRHRGAFLGGGAALALVLLALLPSRGWLEILVVTALYAVYALAVLLAPRVGGRQDRGLPT